MGMVRALGDGGEPFPIKAALRPHHDHDADHPGRLRHLTTNDLQFLGVTEGCVVQAGAGEEPVEEPGPVRIRLSRVLTSAVSWPRLRLARLARDRLRWDQTS